MKISLQLNTDDGCKRRQEKKRRTNNRLGYDMAMSTKR